VQRFECTFEHGNPVVALRVSESSGCDPEQSHNIRFLGMFSSLAVGLAFGGEITGLERILVRFHGIRKPP